MAVSQASSASRRQRRLRRVSSQLRMGASVLLRAALVQDVPQPAPAAAGATARRRTFALMTAAPSNGVRGHRPTPSLFGRQASPTLRAVPACPAGGPISVPHPLKIGPSRKAAAVEQLVPLPGDGAW